MKKILFTLLTIASLSLQAQVNETVVGRVVDGVYVDVIQGGTIPSVNYLAPLDSLTTAAIDSLYLDYAFYQTGVNQDRRKLLRKNNGRLDLFPPSTAIPINTVWRFRTGATNDTVAINPFNSYNLVFDGQTTGNAAYITGLYESMYAEKVATDTILLAGANLIEFSYAGGVVYFTNNAVTPTPNEANNITGFTEVGTETASVSMSVESTDIDNGLYAFEMTCDTDLTTTGTGWTLDLSNLDSAVTYNLSLRYRVLIGSSNWTIGVEIGDGWDADDTTFVTPAVVDGWATLNFSGSPSGTTAKIRGDSNVSFDATESIVIDNVTIAPQ